MLDRSGGLGLPQKTARLPDKLAVGANLAFPAQIADQIEVERRAVAAAEILEAHAEREVHRAADLLVEEDVAREAVDLVVEAERDLADAVRSLVHLEQRPQVVLASGRFGVDDPALLEPEPHIFQLAPAEDGGKREPDRAVDGGLDGARVHLAVRHVLATVRCPPRPALDTDRQI